MKASKFVSESAIFPVSVNQMANELIGKSGLPETHLPILVFRGSEISGGWIG